MNQARRDLGIQYKDATPQPLREYIYHVNRERYNGDPLGPTYQDLIDAKKTDLYIIESSSRPNSDIDKLFEKFYFWMEKHYGTMPH